MVMDEKSKGLLDKSKAGPKCKDDFAAAFYTHCLPLYNTDTHTAHPIVTYPFDSSFSFFALKELSKRDGSD
jgi:hypothetical protein